MESMTTVTFEIFDKKAIVHLFNNIDYNNIVEVEKVFNMLFENSPILIVMDCGKLESIDSVVIAFFVKTASIATDKNIKLAFYNLNKKLSHTFSIIKIQRLIPVIKRDQFEEDFGNFSES
jgi:anti-anti-sigma factor